jgi:two-component system, response regulator PdtaR
MSNGIRAQNLNVRGEFAMSSSRQKKALRPARVLIVEDEYLVAIEIEIRLQDAGFCVVGIAESAARAYELARLERPEIALMDVRLLGSKDGVEAAVQLNADFGIRSVFATAHADPETRARAEVARPLGWVQKPYLAEDVIDLLNRVLS